jgi:CBS domain-containing protein
MSTVRSILEKKGPLVVSVARDATVLDAARQMNDHRIGAVVVTSAGKVVGIFTERDVLIRVVAQQRDPAATQVADVMTCPVACCTPETTRSECRHVMRHRRIRHLPVVEADRLVGIVSIGDILEVNEAEHEETIRYLHEYLYGEWRG